MSKARRKRGRKARKVRKARKARKARKLKKARLLHEAIREQLSPKELPPFFFLPKDPPVQKASMILILLQSLSSLRLLDQFSRWCGVRWGPVEGTKWKVPGA
jgi:hypothetical protein